MMDCKHEMDILREIEIVPVSNTQEIRVLLVRDKSLGVKISLQKWWRPDVDSDWRIGKGFLMDGRQSLKIGRALTSVGGEIVNISNI